MKFAPGTPVPGSSSVRTAEQNATIAAHQMPSSSMLDPGMRDRAITPTGEIVSADLMTIPPARAAEIAAVRAAGTDFAKPSGGYAYILNEDGIPVEYLGCYPSPAMADYIITHRDSVDPVIYEMVASQRGELTAEKTVAVPTVAVAPAAASNPTPAPPPTPAAATVRPADPAQPVLIDEVTGLQTPVLVHQAVEESGSPPVTVPAIAALPTTPAAAGQVEGGRVEPAPAPAASQQKKQPRWWLVIAGAVAGGALGGPVGAIAGAVGGYAVAKGE